MSMRILIVLGFPAFTRMALRIEAKQLSNFLLLPIGVFLTAGR